MVGIARAPRARCCRRVPGADAARLRRAGDPHRAGRLHLRHRRHLDRGRRSALQSTGVPAQDLALLDAFFDSSSFEPMVFGSSPIIPYPMSGRAFDQLRDDWPMRVLSHPLTYLEERATASRADLGDRAVGVARPSTRRPQPVGLHRQVSGDRRRDSALSPLLRCQRPARRRFRSHRVALPARARRRALVPTLGIGSSPQRRVDVPGRLAYQASLFFATMVANYRFSVPCVVLALAVVAITIPEVVKAMTRRSHAGLPAPS